MNIHKLLLKQINKLLIKSKITFIDEIKLQKSSKFEFGDYQINSIMSIANKNHISPKILANKVANIIQYCTMIKKIDVIDPGFINIFLNVDVISIFINKIFYSKNIGIINSIKKQTIVVDYSSPNIAKEMHVGHMRSTIIGDAFVRISEFLGHKVIRSNHIGDWGTQFGMLIAYIIKNNINIFMSKISINDINKFYKKAKKNYDIDHNFSKLSKNYVVKLQNGDKYCQKIWQHIVNLTINHNNIIYNKLNITLKNSDIMGESFYKDDLFNIIKDLKKKKIAKTHNKSVVVILDEFKNKNNESMGIIIKKYDGAYLYATTDIACIKYRCKILKANRIIYYVDNRQSQHLKTIWTIARKAKYISKSVSLEHHMFGMMLNKLGKPFKTREGKTIKLINLLNESIKRARKFIIKKNPNTNYKNLNEIAKIIGIGAIKYSDLSKNRTTNYIFNWDKILTLEGNTSPYIQYAYSRIISIINKNNIFYKNNFFNELIKLETIYEIKLSIHILQFEETIINIFIYGMPHLLCNYLYELSVLFSIFYEKCPILQAKTKKNINSRLKLSILTSRVLKKGLNLLGIETTEKM
ncbi:MAG: arginine--tRNA ligase [Enterobacterales bacterium]